MPPDHARNEVFLMSERKDLTQDQLSALSWQLAQLCRAGVPWSDCPGLLLEDPQPAAVKGALEAIRASLAEGAPLPEAMAASGAFPDYYLRMVEIGQAAGRLDQVFSALAGYYQREDATLQAVRRAVTYPAVMAAIIGLVFLVPVSRVLPVFSQVFAQLGAGVSPVAAAPLSSGSAGRILAYVFAGALLAAAVVVVLGFRGERGLRLLSRGATGEALSRGRFASAMALMLQSGLPLDEALERTAPLLEGTPLAERFAQCRKRSEEGVSFPKAVEETGVLTGLQAGLLSSGFRSGGMEEAMAEVARRCQAEGEERLSRLLSRFEYGLVLLLCACVGLVLLSVMLPLLGVLSAIGG